MIYHVWYAHTSRNGTKKSQDLSSAYFQRVFLQYNEKSDGSISFSLLMLRVMLAFALLLLPRIQLESSRAYAAAVFPEWRAAKKGSHHFHDKSIPTLSNLFSRTEESTPECLKITKIVSFEFSFFFLVKSKIFLICKQRSSLRSLLYNATFWVDFQTLSESRGDD